MPRKLDGTYIESGTITVTQLSGTVNETSNAAYNQANNAYAQANTARSDANTTFATVNNTFGTVNTAITNAHNQANTGYSQANAAYGQANAAYAQANSARSDANTTFATINTSFGTVNTAIMNAHNQANSAFAAANGKLSLSGGTIVGDITVTGNLYVNGTETIVNTSSLTINDPIFLLANNNTTNAVGLGFTAHYGPTQQHTGLIRSHQDNNWYLFEDYNEHILYANNVLNLSLVKLATLRANVNANSLLLVGNTVATQANLTLSYDQANSAFTAANNRVLKSGDTMTGSLTLGAGRTVGNGGIVLSHTGLNTDVLANGRTAGVSTGWGTFRIHQEAGNPGLIIAGDASQTAPYMRIQNNAESALLVFTASGSLGVGVSSPGHKLEVSGSLNQRDAYGTIGSYNSGGQNTPFGRGGPTFSTNITNGQAEIDIWNPFDPATYTSTGILFSQALSSTTRRDLMFLKHDGNVGIGTNSPNAFLHLVTTNNIAPIIKMETTGNSLNTAFWIEDQDANVAAKAIATMDLSAGLGLFNLYAGAYTVAATNYYGSTRGASRIGLHDNNLNFYVSASGNLGGHSTGSAVTWYQTLAMSNTDFIIYTNNGTERARVNSAGNFGIGTSSPAYRLHVDSTSGIGVKVATGGYNWLSLISGYTGNLSVGLNDSGGSGALGINQYNSSGSFVRTALSLDSAGSLTSSTDMRAPIFYDSQNTGYYCDPNGLSAQHRISLRGYAGSTTAGGQVSFEIQNNGGTGDNNVAAMAFHCTGAFATHMHLRHDGYLGIGGWSASAWRWYVNTTNGDMTAAGNVTAYSDPRLKTNIRKIDSALDKVLSLNGVKFQWIQSSVIGNPGKEDYGILSNEVAEIAPELVVDSVFESEDGDKYKTVAYDKLVPFLIEAIKELKAEIDELKKNN